VKYALKGPEYSNYPKQYADLVLIVLSCKSPFVNELRQSYKYLRSLQVFSGPNAIINTFCRYSDESALEDFRRQRSEDFRAIFEENSPHFFINNYPDRYNLSETLQMMNTAAEIVRFISSGAIFT
jgi:hypothetical protein